MTEAVKDIDKKVAAEKEQQTKDKGKTYTQEEFNRELTSRMDSWKAAQLTYSVSQDFSSNGACPNVAIKISGGDIIALRRLGLILESRVIDFMEQNIV